MTNLINKIKNIGNWIKENPKKMIAGAGLAGLIALTSIKDNVHFGSVELNNPQENQYVWGLFPETEINGENSRGNIYTFGLFAGRNELRNNSQITGNMNVYGLFAGLNELRNNSQITGNMNAYGLFAGENDLENNSQITGDISNKGILVNNGVAGFSLGSNDVKNLQNYVVKQEKK